MPMSRLCALLVFGAYAAPDAFLAKNVSADASVATAGVGNATNSSLDWQRDGNHVVDGAIMTMHEAKSSTVNIIMNDSSAKSLDVKMSYVDTASVEVLSQVDNNTMLDLRSQDRNGPICEMHEVLDRGDRASYWVYNKHHQKYLSTDGDNIDLYSTHGSHAVWHFTRASSTTTNTFHMVNDDAQKYMDASHDDHNVRLWVSRHGLGDKGWVPENLHWHLFNADHLTQGAGNCTFYFLHDGSNEWLDTHGGNVHVSPYLINEVLDLEWELIPAPAGRW